MMIPIQRITRYNLLLEKILGYVDTSLQMAEIAEMVLKQSNFICSLFIFFNFINSNNPLKI
jgi:hypothetical protein